MFPGSEKKQVLITGATGNVGLAVIHGLSKLEHHLYIRAGVRNPEKERPFFEDKSVQLTKFDFTDASTYAPALAGCDILFLLRPPQISDVKKYFVPLVAAAKSACVQHVVFLSVQGVENSRFIPHHKIEKLLVESNIPFTFLRPAYFMQNFTTTLKQELVQNRRIYLPAGRAKFALIDVRDIGAVAAKVLVNTNGYINQAIDLTAEENLTFQEMASTLSTELGTRISYYSPNPVQFFLAKIKEHVPIPYILVMIMLHYLPRFQKEPPVTDWVETITGKQPVSFEQFVQDSIPELTDLREVLK